MPWLPGSPVFYDQRLSPTAMSQLKGLLHRIRISDPGNWQWHIVKDSRMSLTHKVCDMRSQTFCLRSLDSPPDSLPQGYVCLGGGRRQIQTQENFILSL